MRVKPGFLYFIATVGAPGGEYIKIGHSGTPEGRLAAISVSCPFPVRLVAKVEGTRFHEIWLQRHLAQWSSHGEWFRAVPEVLDYLEQAKAGRIKGMPRKFFPLTATLYWKPSNKPWAVAHEHI